MQKIEEKNYGVFILRKDFEHISVKETKDFQEAYATWKDLNEKWTHSIKEGVPFVLESPIVTSFDPGLIKEITIQPEMKVDTNRGGINNPYEQKMNSEGLASALKFRGQSLLDEGYR